MKDKSTLKWIYRAAKKQLVPIILLIFGNAGLAVSGVLFALTTRGVIDGAATGEKEVFIRQTLLLLGIILSQLLLRIFCRNTEVRIQAKLEISYKTRLLHTIISREYQSVSAYHSGDLLNRLTSDITIVSEGVTTILPNLMALLTRLGGAFTVLVILEKNFAVIFTACGILWVVVTRLLRGIMIRLHKSVQETDGRVHSFLQEVVESLLVIKVFEAAEQIEAKTTNLLQDNYQAKMKRQTASILANTGFSFVLQAGYLLAFGWTTYRLYLHSISFGTLTAILQLVGQVQIPFANMNGLLPKFYGCIASAERLIELEQLAGESKPKEPVLDIDQLYHKLAAIEFNKLSFQYGQRESGGTLVLDQASLTIDKGDFAVISGISGSGKSTLLKLLLGVYQATEGAINLQTAGGTSIRPGQTTRGLFAYVPQGNLLLSGTVREAVTFIREAAADEEIMEAARISCADKFIRELPQGLNTVLGEKGYGLSEGQIQRLAITRAILSDAPVLLLDEATSALDEATEAKLLKNIKGMENKTCIIISHRRGVLSVCNREILLEDKKLISKEAALYESHTN